MELLLLLGILTAVLAWAAAMFDEVLKLNGRLRWLSKLLSTRRRQVLVKMVLLSLATAFGAVALVVSAHRQRDADARAAKAQADANAAARKRQLNDISAASCAVAQEIEGNKSLLLYKISDAMMFLILRTPAARRSLATDLRQNSGFRSIEFDSRSHQLTAVGESARQAVIGIYAMLKMLSQREAAFLHELDDPSVGLEAALKAARGQRLKYDAMIYLVEKKEPDIKRLCTTETDIGATRKPN